MRHHIRILATLVACGAYCAAGPAFAQTNGTWNSNGDFASWATPGNWVGNTIAGATTLAGGIDATANFTFNITANRQVNVDSGRTVGHLVFSDPSGDHNYTLGSSATSLNVSTGNATITVNNPGQRIVIDRVLAAAAIGGAGADTLEKKGPGTLFLNFDPSGQSQKWLLSAGTFEISNSADRLGANPGAFTADAVTFNGGTLRPSITTGTFSMGQSNQGFTMGASGGTFKVDGTATLALTANPTPALITGPGGLTKTGTGILQIQADNNDYAGDTLVSEGELRLSTNNNVLPNGAGKGNVTVSAGATLNLNDRSDTINGLNGGGIVRSNSGTQTLTLGDGNANGSFSGTLNNTAGTLNLIKTGSGTQTMALGSSLTYGGTTTVNGGTVVVNGTKSGLGAVNVNASGTLAGTGSVAGAISVNADGTLAPGESIGTLATGNLSFTAASSKLALEIDFDGLMDADLINLTGTFSPGGGTLELTFTNAPPVSTPLSFLVVNNDLADSIATTFATITTIGLSAPYEVAVVYNYNDTDSLGRSGNGNDMAILITVVPEARAWMLGGAVSLVSGAAWRVRRRKA